MTRGNPAIPDLQTPVNPLVYGRRVITSPPHPLPRKKNAEARESPRVLDSAVDVDQTPIWYRTKRRMTMVSPTCLLFAASISEIVWSGSRTKPCSSRQTCW